MNNYNNIFEYLYDQRFKKGIVPTLDRIREIYDVLELNIDKNKIITIAGTNGKGSTCAMLTSVLEAHGKKVCRFTSPHLYDITERFYNSDFNNINKQELEKILIKIKSVIDNYQNTHPYHFITFFEYMLLAALVWFDSLKYDYIILEVGMGGRFDATNILDAKFAAITTISLDHVSYLGNTVEKIAFEKAGIIKENQLVTIGNIKNKSLEVIKEKIKEKHAIYTYSPTLILDEFNLKNIKPKGNYQKENIKTSLGLSLSILTKDFDKNKFVKGLESTYWPARYEQISKNPIIIRDVAHNLEGIQALKESLTQDYPEHKKVVIFAIMKDKDYESVLKEIDSFSDFNIFTSIDMDRALSPSVLQDLSKKSSLIEHDSSKVINLAKEKANDLGSKSIIIITGSIFLMEKIS